MLHIHILGRILASTRSILEKFTPLHTRLRFFMLQIALEIGIMWLKDHASRSTASFDPFTCRKLA